MSSHQPRIPRKRYSIPALLVVLVLLGALVALAAAPPNIDTFATAMNPRPLTVNVGNTGSVSNTSGSSNDDILGNERDLYVYNVAGTGASVTLDVVNGEYSHSQNANVTANSVLTYDGVAGPGYPTTQYNGLCSPCKDLTQGGTRNGFRFRVLSNDRPVDVRIRVYDGSAAGNYSEVTIPDLIPDGIVSSNPVDVLVEYPVILAGTTVGTGANFSTVGAVEFEFIGDIAATDFTLDTIDVSVFDWGDLPETTGTCTSSPASGYATTQACKGPRHAVPTGTLRLGTQVDPLPAPPPTGVGEFNGQPTIGANGDNLANSNDEQGVTTLWAGGSCTEWWCNGPNGGKIRVQVNGTGYLLGWIDFDENGFEVDEVIANQAVTTGSYDISFNIPAGTLPTSGTKNLYARFRLFGDGELTSGNCGTTGCRPYLFDGRDGFNELSLEQEALNQSKDGEVEDYLWPFNVLAVTLADFSAVQQGDAVLLTWETNSELNNRGFNLYRGTSDTAPDRQLNETLIPSQSQGNPGGFVYTWEDRADLQAGTTYFYWVEDVDINGAATMHGPVSVDFTVPTAVTLSSVQASPAAAGPVVPLAGTLLALLAPLAGALAVRRRRA